MVDSQEVKEHLVELVRQELKKKKLPEKIKIDSGSTIVNPAKFFESHLCVVLANEGNVKQVYGSRLSIALISVGIDIHDLKRKAERQVDAKKK